MVRKLTGSASMSADSLRGVGRECEAAERGVRRRAAWQGDSRGVGLRGGQIEDVDVVGGAEVQPLALLVVKNKFVQGRLGVDLRGLRGLKGEGRGCSSCRECGRDVC